MNKPNVCLSLFAVLFFPVFISAQNDNLASHNSTETHIFYLKVLISSEPDTPSDTIFGLVDRPHPDLTIKAGTKIRVIEIFENSEKEISEIGYFHVLRKENNYWLGRYELNDYGNEIISRNLTLPVCLAETEVEMPHRPFRSLFFSMYSNGIEFTDVFEEPVYTLSEILENDSEHLEQSIFDKLVEDIRFTAKEMRKTMDSPMIEGGIFEGTDLFSAMEKSTARNIQSFLRYVDYRPEKYRGHAWKISETYATWLVSDSPLTREDLLDILINAADNEEKFYAYVNDVNHEILKSWLTAWLEMGDVEMANDRTRNAIDLFIVCSKIAVFLKDYEQAGWAHFNLAQAFPEGEASDALMNYEEALNYFSLIDEKAGIIATQNNMGYILNDLGKYKEAAVVLEKAYALEKEIIPGKDDKTAATVALTLRNLGNSFLGQKKFKKALDFYEEGLSYAGQNNPLSLQRKSALYFQMAETFKALGRDDDYEFYTELAVSAFMEYEALLKENKKL